MGNWIIFIILVLGSLSGLLYMITSTWELAEASKRKTRTEKDIEYEQEQFSRGCGCGCVVFISFAFAAFVMGGVIGLWLQ